MSDKAKGWVYVLIQFLLFAIIILSSRLERKYFNVFHSRTIAYISIGLIVFIINRSYFNS
ncbi:MAG: hypothetical protein L0Y79_12805 [Chlorobi bacterium]|nr:hypothetical protein [Chlorobiota bacterium]MCI0716731.1 hypothetical protein [Chlorobiota bacterium]